MERKLAGKFFRNFGHTSQGCPVFGNFKKCCCIRAWKLPKIRTGRFGWMETTRRNENENPSPVPRRFWIGHSWTLPWAVTSPRDTRRELKPITGSLARSLSHFARTKDQERPPKDKAGKTHCLFARFRSFAAYLRARQTKPPATQALDWPCTVHINSSSATFFSISPVIHNAS